MVRTVHIGRYDRSPGNLTIDELPFAGSAFGSTASAVVRHLDQQLTMDLWIVTRLADHQHIVVASTGCRLDLTRVGQPFCWPSPLLGVGVRSESSMAPGMPEPGWTTAGATDPLGPLKAFLVVPLRGDDGQMVGTLAAFGACPPRRVPEHLADLAVLLGDILATILVAEDLTRTHWEAASRAIEIAEQDRLTGLRNRHGWASALLREESNTQRTGSSTTIVVLDLDNLKRINDNHGHSAGDDLLVRCAEILVQNTRAGDTPARLGGDEFGLLMTECDEGYARVVLSRLRLALIRGGVSASAGSATRHVGEDLENTWRRADEAMYLDKRTGERPRTVPAVTMPEQRSRDQGALAAESA